MAILGFIVLMVVGVLFFFAGVFITFLGSSFGGSAVEGLIPAGIGAVFIWLAIHFAPFTVTFVGG